MSKTIRIVAVLAALGGWNAATHNTPLTTLQSAFAEALPAVWVNKIKKLTKNITGARQKLAADPSGIVSDDFKAKQFGDRIENFRSSLAKVPASEDAVLTDAKAMLAALDAEFAAAKGGASAPAAAPATTSTPTTTATPAPAPAAAPAAPASDIRPLVSGERVRVKKMARDITNVRGSIVTTGPSELQDPNRIAAFQKRLGQFTDALKKYPQADDPDVMAARNAYLGLREDLSTEFARAKQQLAELGDVQARLATVDKNRDTYPLPDRLQIPFTDAEAKAWVNTASAAQTAAQFDLGQLREIAPLAYLPANNGTPRANGVPYDSGDIGALAGRIDHYISKVNDEAKGTLATLENNIAGMKQNMGLQFQEDPKDDEKAWIFLQDGRDAQAHKLYDDAESLAKMAISFKSALGQDTPQESAFLKSAEDARALFVANRETALSNSRLPEPKSDDAAMLAIAKEVLEKPRYEYGAFGPIILTTDKVTEHEKKESEIDIDKVDVVGSDLKLSGTETTWTYKWKEFRFAAPLQNEDGTWRIWWITAKNYSSGSSITPIGEWIAGRSTEGNLIREENF